VSKRYLPRGKSRKIQELFEGGDGLGESMPSWSCSGKKASIEKQADPVEVSNARMTINMNGNFFIPFPRATPIKNAAILVP
jgi:hypothetical protein